MDLDSAPTDLAVTLGRPDLTGDHARRLAELGLRAGSTVTPLHRTAGGGRVVGVGTARIAVARPVLTRLGLHPGPAHLSRRRAPRDAPPGGLPDTVPPRPVAPPFPDAATPGVPPNRRWTGPVRSRAPWPLGGCHGDQDSPPPVGAPAVALVGPPNVGKSSLFNSLTGARRQVGNWPGTTVEIGRGTWRIPAADRVLALVDLPGTYSLDPVSPDEQLTRELLVGDSLPPGSGFRIPDLVVVVISTTDLARGLYLLSQIRELPVRVVVALTMTDVARRRRVTPDLDALRTALALPVVSLDTRRRQGIDDLGKAAAEALSTPVPPPSRPDHPTPEEDLAAADARFAWVSGVVTVAIPEHQGPIRTRSDRIDRVVTSPVIGPWLFLAVMWGVFQLTTAGAAPLVAALDRFVAGPVSGTATGLLDALGLADTWVRGLVVDALVAGVGMVLTFVPLMSIMFVLLALLEDSGYLARAAVVMDRLMRAVGLPGRAFVPLIVGFGCNVPAVSATRILPDARHRLLTALVVPFTSCSARLPVYVLLGAALFGRDAGSLVFGMYLASIVMVVLGGWLLRMTLLRGTRHEPLVLDLPGYQLPSPRLLLAVTRTRLAAFLRTATGIIVVAVTGVWLLTAVPTPGSSGGFGKGPIEDSLFATAARTVAPVFGPAGFGEWHTTGALAVGMVAKEAIVSSWAQTHAAETPDDLSAPGRLGSAVRADLEAASGGHPRLAGLALLVFVLGYTPCVATMTAQVREIGVRWTLTGLAVGLSLAWVVAVVVFQIGRVIV